MTQPALELDTPFWRFSVTAYGQPGVAGACLALQAARGLDVNLLLFCGWLGAECSVTLRKAELAEAAAVAGDWHHRVVVPLRGARTDIKTMPVAVLAEVARLREAIKAAELQSEQIEQALLFQLAERRWPLEASGDGRAATGGARAALAQNLQLCLATTPDPLANAGADPPQLTALIKACLRSARAR